MPRTWTPKVYLGVLYLSVNRNTTLSIERIELEGHTYTSMNDVHGLFLVPSLNPRLTKQADFFQVRGGPFFGSANVFCYSILGVLGGEFKN